MSDRAKRENKDRALRLLLWHVEIGSQDGRSKLNCVFSTSEATLVELTRLGVDGHPVSIDFAFGYVKGARLILSLASTEGCHALTMVSVPTPGSSTLALVAKSETLNELFLVAEMTIDDPKSENAFFVALFWELLHSAQGTRVVVCQPSAFSLFDHPPIALCSFCREKLSYLSPDAGHPTHDGWVWGLGKGFL